MGALFGGGMPGLGGGGGDGLGGGGPLGAMGMDLSMHKMPIIGGFFQNPAELHKQEQFSRAARAYSHYRPEVEQARMNALKNTMSSYQGAMDVLNAMTGGHGGKAPQVADPMGPSMTSQGASMDPGDMAAKGQMVPPGLMGGLGGGDGGPGGIMGMIPGGGIGGLMGK